tara:strand:+ start:1159 stop:1581 length:423 start_codon:yes stop_codon:yes gene_type:complete
MSTKRLEKPYKLRKHPDNPRLIKDQKYFALVKSMETFPEMLEKRPIVVNEDLVVLGGNMRLRAAQDAGMSEVWIDVTEGWSEAKQKEFVIKDNTNAGEWDFNMLANEWESDDLLDWGVDIPEQKQTEEKENKPKCDCCGK